LDEAENVYREMLMIAEHHLDPNEPYLAIPLGNLAGVHSRRKQFAEAELLYLRAAAINKTAHGVESTQYAGSLSNLGVLYSEWAAVSGDSARRVREEEYKGQALAITHAARGARHHVAATMHNNLAVMKANFSDWPSAITDEEQAVAIMLSLDLAQHPNTQTMARGLAHYWEKFGQADKSTRLRDGDISDLLPVIAQIETVHHAWVAEDPEKRHFGPPSFFEPKNDEDVELWFSAFALAGGDVDGLKSRLQSRELSKDDFARIVPEQIARKVD
jgi:Tetratricopeptide repeat